MHAGAREGIIAGKSGGIISRYGSHYYALLLRRTIVLRPFTSAFIGEPLNGVDSLSVLDTVNIVEGPPIQPATAVARSSYDRAVGWVMSTLFVISAFSFVSTSFTCYCTVGYSISVTAQKYAVVL